MPLNFLTDHTSPLMLKLDERVVAQWNRRRPDLPVSLRVLEHEDFRDQLEKLLTGERPPDVLTWFAGNRMRSLVDRGLMHDIAKMWDTAGLHKSYDARFRPKTGTATHFLPTSTYWWAVYYRPSLLRSVGVDARIETWADLRAAANALRAAGIAPFALGARYRCPAAAWFDYLNLRLNGPQFHHELMALRQSYTDDRVRAVFAFWRKLIDEGWFLGDPAEYDEEQAVDAVMERQAGMTLIGSYIADEYVAEDEPDLDFFRFPIIDPAVPVGEDAPVDGYFIAGRSPSASPAEEFLAYLGSREVQESTISVLNVLPTRADVPLDNAPRHVPKGMEILRRAQRLSQFYDLDTPWELADAGMEAFVAFLREPSRSDELLRDMETLRIEFSAREVASTRGEP